jgi:hypothetical protein
MNSQKVEISPLLSSIRSLEFALLHLTRSTRPHHACFMQVLPFPENRYRQLVDLK